MLTIKTPAKVNIGLNVLTKREDSFHNIKTLFASVSLFDEVTVALSETEEFSIFCNMPGIPVDETNLAAKAFRILENEFAIPPVSISLHKNIPAGSGLAGGSSNAAAVFCLLNDIFELKLPKAKLMNYALLLGSDVPYFLEGGLCLAEGRGEVLQKVHADLSGYEILLCLSEASVMTGNAYAAVDEKPDRNSCAFEAIIAELMSGGENLSRFIANDFEPYAFSMFPHLAQIKKALNETNALAASLSGSGSCVYGIYQRGRLPSDFHRVLGRSLPDGINFIPCCFLD